MATLKLNSPAYYDSFAGPIPCKIIKAFTEDGMFKCDIIITTDTLSGYKKGDLVYTFVRNVFPKAVLKVNSLGQYRIDAYKIEL